MSINFQLSPSRAARRLACPGSLQAELRCPKTSTGAAALEGQAAHEVLAYALKNKGNVELYTSSEGITITDEMKECARWAYDIILDGVHKTNSVLHIEEMVSSKLINKQISGTPDVWVYHPKLNLVELYDYKYGFRPVEAFENPQLAEYAFGIAAKIFETFQVYPKFEAYILQPRPFFKIACWPFWIDPITSTIINHEAFVERLKLAEEEALSPNPRLQASPQCFYCTAAASCTTLRDACLNALDYTGRFQDEITGQPLVDALLIGRHLTHLRNAAKIIDARMTAIEEHAKELLICGEVVPGWSLQPGMSRLKWEHSIDQVKELGTLYGIDVLKSPELITPTQAIKAGIPEVAVIAGGFAKRLPGELKLTETKADRKFKQ